MSNEAVVFIGLGNMGLPMANNLAKSGLSIHAFDPQLGKSDDRLHGSITVHATLATCASQADLIYTMLPDGNIVLDVLQQLIAARTQTATIVDCSTIDINHARQAHDIADNHHYEFFDAPVSGGVAGAAAGILTAMVGGDQQKLEDIKKYMTPMFGNIIFCGDAGNGQAAKICNNMLLATTMIGTGETFNLGKKLGLNEQTLYDILSSSTGSCWSVNNYCPVAGVGPQSPADNDFKPGFSGHMMLKDMNLTQSAASAADIATPLGQMATQLYREFVEQGGGPEDFSAIINYLQTLNR